MDAYTGLKCLWLEGNGLQKIENLDALTAMRCLYLQKNLIRRMEGLSAMTQLDTVNVSYNGIRAIEGLGELRRLNTLQFTHNAAVVRADERMGVWPRGVRVRTAMACVACRSAGHPKMRTAGIHSHPSTRAHARRRTTSEECWSVRRCPSWTCRTTSWRTRQ